MNVAGWLILCLARNVIFFNENFGLVDGSFCESDSDCTGSSRRFCCRSSSFSRRKTCEVNCIGRYCTNDLDCRGPRECCDTLNRCTTSGCSSECDTNSDCQPGKYCCKKLALTEQSACLTNCIGEFCDTDIDCGGVQECCSLLHHCTTYGCRHECHRNSDCTNGTFCCVKGHDFDKNTCESSCIDESCNTDSDCGSPGLCCSDHFCTQECQAKNKRLGGWIIATIFVTVCAFLLLVLVFGVFYMQTRTRKPCVEFDEVKKTPVGKGVTLKHENTYRRPPPPPPTSEANCQTLSLTSNKIPLPSVLPKSQWGSSAPPVLPKSRGQSPTRTTPTKERRTPPSPPKMTLGRKIQTNSALTRDESPSSCSSGVGLDQRNGTLPSSVTTKDKHSVGTTLHGGKPLPPPNVSKIKERLRSLSTEDKQAEGRNLNRSKGPLTNTHCVTSGRERSPPPCLPGITLKPSNRTIHSNATVSGRETRGMTLDREKPPPPLPLSPKPERNKTLPSRPPGITLKPSNRTILPNTTFNGRESRGMTLGRDKSPPPLPLSPKPERNKTLPSRPRGMTPRNRQSPKSCVTVEEDKPSPPYTLSVKPNRDKTPPPFLPFTIPRITAQSPTSDLACQTDQFPSQHTLGIRPRRDKTPPPDTLGVRPVRDKTPPPNTLGVRPRSEKAPLSHPGAKPRNKPPTISDVTVERDKPPLPTSRSMTVREDKPPRPMPPPRPHGLTLNKDIRNHTNILRNTIK